MSVFGRRKKDQEPDEVEGGLDAVDATDGPDEQDAVAPPPRPTGPWDRADAPDDEVERLDLGGLLVPVPPDTEVRVDVSPEREVVAATLVHAGSSMQVNAFAAPRSYGIWAEVREEIGTALRQSGGRAQDVEGPYGTELHAAVPTEVAGQGIVLAPARFVGVDGPRWFLRALFTGPAATDASAAAPLEVALRDVHVVRGNDPMAVRDPLPLRLPEQVAALAAEQEAGATGEQPAATDEPDGAVLEMPERGPEITETR